MSKLLRASAAAVFLTLALVPAASAYPGPPLDPVHVDFGGGCSPPPDNPCDPYPGSGVTYDRTYPSRLAAWAEGILP